MRRILLVGVLVAVWLGGGVLVQGCGKAAATLEPLSTAVPAVAPTDVAAKAAVWMWSDARLVAVDTVTGELLGASDKILGEAVQTLDRRWEYRVMFVQPDTETLVYLTVLDLLNPSDPKRILLDTFPLGAPNFYEKVLATVLLSSDEQTVYVALTQEVKGKWRTDLVRIDLKTDTVSRWNGILEDAAEWGPNVTLAATADGAQVLVARSVARWQGVKRFYSTRVVQVDTGTGKVTWDGVIPGDVNADNNYAVVEVTPDDTKFYVIDYSWLDSGESELRFTSYAFENHQLLVSNVNVLSARDTGCDWRFYFGQNQDLWQWCGDVLRYLDPATGKFSGTVALRDGTRGSSSFAEYVISRDGKSLYTVFPVEREVVVMDLATRQVTQRAVLRDQAAMPSFRRALLGLFTGTADAKALSRPVMAMSPDEKWLAFVDLRDYLEGGDGLWAVETATLKPLGHWVKTDEIVGLRASADGKQLYALNGKTQKLQVLDVSSGAVVRALKLPVLSSSGLLGDTRP